MLYGQVELHNVAEVVQVADRPGVLLQRVPESVRTQLRPGARTAMRRAAGMEIRLVSEKVEPVTVSLACYEGEGQAYLYYGSYFAARYRLTSEPIDIRIEPRFPFFIPFDEEIAGEAPFADRVWRLVLQGGQMHLLGVEGASVRPPKAEEVPKLRYLAYGTSITQGVAADLPELTYVNQVAWRLGLDAVNLGAAGAAYCEAALADYIAARDDWDIASLCVSINMFNGGVPAAEFRERAAYMAETIAAQNPRKPVVCIGLFPSFADRGRIWPERTVRATTDEYREALKSVVEQSGLANLFYVDGRELLTRFYGLTHDWLHPGNLGMIEIGERLAKYMENVMAGFGLRGGDRS